MESGSGWLRGWPSPEPALSCSAATQLSPSQRPGELRESTGAKVLVVTADVSREDDAARAAAETLAQFGRIDILFNNAGINIRKQPQELSLDDWDKVLKVNLTSAFLMSKAVYAAMKRERGGKIINIGSMTSIFGAPFAAAYASTKGGIVQLTKSLALAWAADNIQVNAILPGWFDTELTEKAREQIPGLHERVLAPSPSDDGQNRPTWRAPRSGWRAGAATTSPASPSRSTAGTRRRFDSERWRRHLAVAAPMRRPHDGGSGGRRARATFCPGLQRSSRPVRPGRC